MARKKAEAAAATAAQTKDKHDSPDDGKDLQQYSEAQRDEYLATQAIYPDEFVRIHGRKEAWKVCTKCEVQPLSS